MRVLFITQVIDKRDDNLGAIHGWIANMAREVEEIHAIALRTGDVDLPSNVRVHSLGKDRGNGKLRQFQIFNSVAGGLALRKRVDVFFAHMVPRYALLVSPYRLVFRIPTVMWYAHNSADLKLKAANLCVDRFVSASPDSFPLGPAKCTVVGSGVDTELFCPPNLTLPPPLPHGGRGETTPPSPVGRGEGGSGLRPTRFLSLGRISPRKELDTLISAADLLVNRWGRRDARFVVVGAPLAPEDRDYDARLKARVQELELEPFFTFAGGVPHSETVRRMQTCDFFVNMHVEGGLGKAVLEAMSCGKPAFVSTPTYYDRFPQHRSTFLFAPRDPEDLARKMLGVLDMPPEERARAGRELREWVVQEHDLRRQMSRIVEVFRQVRGGAPSTSR